jgi:hypothetical protein
MLHRKKSLKGVEKEFELHVEKAKKLREELATGESKCQGCPNTVELDKTKIIVTTLLASLKDVETNL